MFIKYQIYNNKAYILCIGCIKSRAQTTRVKRNARDYFPEAPHKSNILYEMIMCPFQLKNPHMYVYSIKLNFKIPGVGLQAFRFFF